MLIEPMQYVETMRVCHQSCTILNKAAYLCFYFQIRKWVHEQKGKLLTIRPEDEEYVKRRTAELAVKAEMAAKQTVQDTVKDSAK